MLQYITLGPNIGSDHFKINSAKPWLNSLSCRTLLIPQTYRDTKTVGMTPTGAIGMCNLSVTKVSWSRNFNCLMSEMDHRA